MGLGLAMALHSLGFSFWMGGLLAAQTVSLERARGREASAALERLERRFLLLGAYPGLLLAAASGSALLAFNPAHFMAEAWFVAKLALAAALAALTALSAAARRRLGTPRAPAASLLELKRALTLLCALSVLLLAVLRPF